MTNQDPSAPAPAPASSSSWFRRPTTSKVERPPAPQSPEPVPESAPVPTPAPVPAANDAVAPSPTAETAPEAAPATDGEELKAIRAKIASAMARPAGPSRLPQLGDVVLEACAEVHAEVLTCMRRGSWWDTATLCQAQQAQFWKCAEDFKYALKKLGYARRNVTDAQRVEMVKETDRIVRDAWTKEGGQEALLEKLIKVELMVPSDGR
ncbi:hypothetical protein AMAG_13025 [Allomyces macrogynus ATCC 38327]|uniref:COX assembly mitochondrial protein n=1 Tax=Allomyces macrogynus (strain ATCC 38327) TaxID=578462 RepID=A0A0L0T0Q5_ALLM3|nr:hypothetical protein AMAG_13025 [Allomyces macrogynus ATCC 38327]|eukprot:KNE68368.1 hypothetical protein AMAG_13025 [Allomyces macrogynus ATCC 38327]